MAEERTKPGGLVGLRVLSLESRRAPEMAKLIENHGGRAIVAPSMREVPIESNAEAVAFAQTLAADGFDMVIFLTGVGTRALARVVETVYPIEQFIAALRRVDIVARGPKPVAALKELGVPVTLAVPEPNTWRDLLRALDEKRDSLPLSKRRVALQEYGASNPELLAGLAERGAGVKRVPVYQWALPEDTAPLRAAVEAISRAEIDMALFTTSIQVVHLLQIAQEMNLEQEMRRGFAGMVVGSIGPITSAELREHGFHVDLEPAHPKMGFLVNEAAQHGAAMLGPKRRGISG
jgi:uroporphyrinogen-III synthase